MPAHAVGDLRSSIDHLYEVFAGYPFRLTMPCCIPHCFSFEDILKLDAKPLRELSAENLSSFAADLLSTCGEVEDFKHFLPQIFELTSEGAFTWPYPEIALGKLRYAQWQSWPHAEQAAIRRFLLDWWKVSLLTPPGLNPALDPSTVLSAVASADEDLWGYLETWLQMPALEAATHLAQFVLEHSMQIHLGRSFNPFLSSRQIPLLKSWLTDRRTVAYLEEAFFRYSDAPEAEKISLAVRVLEG